MLWIFLPPLPRGGSVFGENSFYRAPAGRWAQKACAGCPQQRYITGEPGKVQGRDRVGIVEGSCGYRARRVSIRGKFFLSRNPGYRTMGVAMWLKIALPPPGSPPRGQSSGPGPSANCGYFCPLCPTGVQYSGKIRFIEPQRVDGHRRPVPGAPSSGTSRESQAKFRDGTVREL